MAPDTKKHDHKLTLLRQKSKTNHVTTVPDNLSGHAHTLTIKCAQSANGAIKRSESVC